MSSYVIDIRDRRQVTLPQDLLSQLGVDVGDSFQVKVARNQATFKPQKQIALEALSEIKNAFSNSNVKEDELQKSLTKQRKTA